MISPSYSDIHSEIEEISYGLHAKQLVSHAIANKEFIKDTLRDVSRVYGKKAIVISAGPSVHNKNALKKIKNSNFNGVIIAVDGSYLACIKAGLVPDYVLTLDPHPTRIVRWFGDPNIEINSANDDYFSRQDLDIAFRNNLIKQNSLHIKMVDEWARHSNLVISSSSPENVVKRVLEAGFKKYYWWNPLVDMPNEPLSISRRLFNINHLPCINTGGNVGTAAWVFASTILKTESVALVGMDFGYYEDLPYSQTQKYYELLERIGGDVSDLDRYFPKMIYPQTGEIFYTDPTYAWYKKNFLELLQQSKIKTYNCTEGGTLFGPEVECISLAQYLDK